MLGDSLRRTSLALVLAAVGCTEPIPITTDSDCALGEWVRRVEPRIVFAAKESWPPQCIPARAVTEDGAVHCLGFLRIPEDELAIDESCESLGLATWSTPTDDGGDILCVLPILDDSADPEQPGFVIGESNECTIGEPTLGYRLQPLPLDLPGQAELRCQVTADPACPWE